MTRAYSLDELMNQWPLDSSKDGSKETERRARAVEIVLETARAGATGPSLEPPRLSETDLQATHQLKDIPMSTDRDRDRKSFQELAKLATSSKPQRLPGDDQSDAAVIDFAALAATSTSASIPNPPSDSPLSAAAPAISARSVPEPAPASRATQPSVSSPALPPVERAPRISVAPSANAPPPAQPVASVPTPAPAPASRVVVEKKAPVVPITLAAVAAIAAGAFFLMRPSSSEVKPSASAATTNASAARPGSDSKGESTTVDPSSLSKTPSLQATATTKPTANAGDKDKDKKKDEPEEAKKDEPPAPAVSVAVAPPVPSGSSGTLDDEMHRAVGVKKEEAAGGANAGGGDQGPGNVPARPSQGAVQGALGAVLPGARGCLGPDDPIARATITFGSSGGVTGVGVSGGSPGSEGCIRGALMRAKVPPFSSPSFSTGVTIRPN